MARTVYDDHADAQLRAERLGLRRELRSAHGDGHRVVAGGGRTLLAMQHFNEFVNRKPRIANEAT